MPNIVAHYVCGKLVSKKLNINDKNYIKGNLYPDYVDKNKHYRIEGYMFEIPDVDTFMREEQMNDRTFKLGFLTHLILDRLFLEEYVINNIYSNLDKKINIFVPDKIYTDYTNISQRLLNHYNLNLDDIDNLMLREKEYIDFQKYKSDTEVIRTCTSGELQYLDPNSFITFLDDSSEKIADYIKRKNI